MRLITPIIAIVLLSLVLSGLPVSHASAGGSATATGSRTLAVPLPGAPVPAAPPLPPVSSGPGTYFSTSSVPAPPTSQQTCFSGTCVVAADNPSLNLTSTGALVAAYTTWSTEAPCSAARPAALTEIGLTVSANLGSTWSAPVYLGNPDCSAPAVSEYPSAWEPSLTSLANGTLVLSYIEYNVSAVGGAPPRLSFQASNPSVTYDRLVVTRSFNGGSSWTAPIAVNTSANPTLSAPAFPPQHPSITAIGDTVYLAWENLTDQLAGFATGSSQVHLVVSTNGGATFGSAIDLPVSGAYGTRVAMNPTVAVDPAGNLYVAYTSNLTFHAFVGCLNTGCYYNGWTADVVVQSSSSNGSSFHSATVASQVIVPPPRWGPFFDPSPALAVGPSGGQVYVAYSSGYLAALCTQYGCYTGVGTSLSVANSSTSGATFSAPHAVAPRLRGGSGVGADQLYNPTLGVTSDGVLQLSATFDNFTTCAYAPAIFSTFCGPQAQIYLNSTDNGTSFSPPIWISDNSTQLYADPNNPDGEYASLVTAGTHVLVAWTSDICDAWNTSAVFGSCPWPGTGGASGIQISSLASGPGITLTFTETGLPTGVGWNIDLLGNVRVNATGGALAFQGVPVGFNASWNVSVAASYGYRFNATFSVPNPSIFSASSTIRVSFTEQVLFDLLTAPNIAPYAFGTPYCGAGSYWDMSACPGINWNVTPMPGPEWVSPGSVLPLTVTPNNVLYCNPSGTCYNNDILNLSFQSWTGTGASASNTTARSTNVTVNGPVNETANFAVQGWCAAGWVPSFFACLGPNISYAFHETGLPAGTNWGVSLSVGNQAQSNQSTTPWNTFVATLNGTVLNYTVWTVPAGTGRLYLPSSTPVSPIAATRGLVEVNFTLTATSAAKFPVYLSTTNLPGGSTWGVSVDSISYGSSTPTAPTFDVSGGSHTFSAAPVVLTNATKYVPAVLDTLDLSATGTWNNFTTFPATVTVDGSTYAYLGYDIQYWLTDTNSSCGTVSALSGWYATGASVGLTATASANCLFVGWAGTGPGSVSSSTRTITVIVGGPVSEYATFEPTAPRTWNLTIDEGGLPANTAFSIGLGDQSYFGTTQFTIRGLSSGTYPLSLPYDYVNGSDGTRFLPSVTSTSLPMVLGGYQINADAWLNLSFVTQDLVNVSAGAGGTVSPAGTSWDVAGTQQALVATPDAGQQFLGWAGSGPGAASGTATTLLLVVSGPAVEVATFGPIPVPPAATFALTVTETGLPSGTAWSAQIGTAGIGGSSSQVGVPEANGTYPIVLPIVLGAPGVRYVPTPMFTNVSVTGSTAETSVSYGAQYYVAIVNSTGGSVNATSGWFDAGTVLVLGATSAGSNETFGTWTGTGSGSYTGSNGTISVTVNGPISESAAFQPVPPPSPAPTSSSGSSTGGIEISLALLAVLLVVGLAAGLLLGRKRPPQPPSEEPSEEPAEPLYGEPPAPEA